MSIIRNSEPNDCAICAILNAANALGIKANRDEIKANINYHPEHGSSLSLGFEFFVNKYGLLHERFPLPKDLNYDQVNEHVSRAMFEKNKDIVFRGCIEKLKNGWVAVTQHDWSPSLSHAVAFIGATDNAIKVACSVRGEYLADEEFFHNKRNTVQGLFTEWAHK